MRHTISLALGLIACLFATSVRAQDAQTCFSAAEIVKMKGKLSDADKSDAHQACMRALTESSNVVQKYHLQEADWDVMGTRPKTP